MLGIVINPAIGETFAGGDRPGYTVQPKRNWLSFHLPGKRGYLVRVVAEAKMARIEVLNGNAVVVYEAPAERSKNKVSAQFGSLGRLAMRFKPLGPFVKSTEPQGDCRGRRAQVQRGIFEGRFRWHGEKDFSAAMTHKVAGLSVKSFREVCSGETAAIGKDEMEKPLLIARSQSFGKVREVEAYGSPDEGIELIGRLVERRVRLSTERTVFSFVKEGGLQVGSEGKQMSLSPVDPFHGFAELYVDLNGEKRWRGNLKAKFPGRGYLSLAGSGFAIVSE